MNAVGMDGQAGGPCAEDDLDRIASHRDREAEILADLHGPDDWGAAEVEAARASATAGPNTATLELEPVYERPETILQVTDDEIASEKVMSEAELAAEAAKEAEAAEARCASILMRPFTFSCVHSHSHASIHILIRPFTFVH